MLQFYNHKIPSATNYLYVVRNVDQRIFSLSNCEIFGRDVRMYSCVNVATVHLARRDRLLAKIKAFAVAASPLTDWL